MTRTLASLQHCALLGSLLAVHGIVVAYNAIAISPVVDEPAHLIAGISIWVTGRYDVYCVNPPLVKQLAAIPATLVGFEGPREIFTAKDIEVRTEGWRSQQFVAANGASTLLLVSLGRLVCIPFALVGLWTCIRWGEELYGPASGLFAGVVWCVSPTVQAHAPLMTADCAATSLGLLAGYHFWRWLRAPNWRSVWAAGTVLGLALLTKTLWIILFGLWPALWIGWLCMTFGQQQGSGQPADAAATKPVRQLGQLIAMLGLALLVLNLGFLFEGSFAPLRSYRFQSTAFGGKDAPQLGPGNRFDGHWLGELPVPVPSNYVRGIDLQKRDFEDYPFAAYLRGETRNRGWWYYYLYALGVKEAIGILVLFSLAAAGSVLCSSWRVRWRDELVLLTPAIVVFVLVSSQTGMNHHFRYVLPALPAAFILSSKFIAEMASWTSYRSVVALGLFGWAAISSLGMYPHTIGYFNESVGGAKNGWKHLDDSNTDWGQGLYALKRWRDRHADIRPLYLAPWDYTLDPKLVGVDYTPMPPTNRSPRGAIFPVGPHGPVPGWHVISTNEIIEHDFDYLAELKPVECIAGCYLVYHVSLEDANRIRRERGLPEIGAEGNVPPLD